jgi:hypothetical protein
MRQKIYLIIVADVLITACQKAKNKTAKTEPVQAR